MNIPWADIFAMILKLMEDCQEPTPENLRNPGLLQTFRLERVVRDASGLSRADWRKHGREVMAKVYADRDAASDDELQDFVAMSKSA